MGWFITVTIIIIGIMYMVNDYDSTMDRLVNENGLPMIDVLNVQCDNLPDGIEVIISCAEDGLNLTANGYEKFLPYGDILDITLESASEAGFSVGKAAMGTALLGGAGAVAGVSSKKEVKKMVISHKSEVEVEYMVFVQNKIKDSNIKTEAIIIDRAYNDIKQVIDNWDK